MNFPRYSPFPSEWISFAIFFALILGFIVISELVKKYFDWPVERSRKLVHVIVGIMISISPFLFTTALQPVVLAIIFIVINTLALKSENFQAMHATERKTFGTIYFPWAFLILALFWWERPVTLITGTLLMTFADTLAATIGNTVKNARVYRLWSDQKSLEGSAAMFIASYFIVLLTTLLLREYIFVYITTSQIFGLAGFMAIIATIAESNSKAGSDNFSVPVISAIAMDIYLVNFANDSILLLIGWTLLSCLLFIAAIKFRSLTGSGGAGAFLIGILIFGAGGLKWIVPLLLFFTLSSLLSRIGGKNKFNNLINYQKSSRRDLLQVLANGGIAVIIAVINFYNPSDWLYLIYLSAIAAATADTWATELGYFSKRNPRHILTLKRVPKGTSGGISMIGTMGTILGALVIGLSGLFFGLTLSHAILIAFAGIFGSLIDSLLGGTIQARFHCPKCKAMTEQRIHCDGATKHFAGFHLIDNDAVNFICTLSGAVIILIIIGL